MAVGALGGVTPWRVARRAKAPAPALRPYGPEPGRLHREGRQELPALPAHGGSVRRRAPARPDATVAVARRDPSSPLLKGPYVSLSRPFRQGAAVSELVREGVFHPHMRQRIPDDITHVYGHQEDAIRAIRSGKTTLVSTGTGSGKTECFLYPIVSKCLELRDQNAVPGISAVIVYPMNALAEDQLGRLRSLLAGARSVAGCSPRRHWRTPSARASEGPAHPGVTRSGDAGASAHRPRAVGPADR